MKLFPLALTIAVTAAANFSQDSSQKPTQTPEASQTPKASVEAEIKLELNQTAGRYKAGDFVAAQQHAERAVLLDPTNKTAAIYLARVRHQRYRPNDETPENVALARSAIDAYQRVLILDADNEEAYKAIAVLYASTHQEELLKAWVLQRAMNPQVADGKRADAYAVLAGGYWDCSFKFTELIDHKVVDETKPGSVVTYKMGNDVAEFYRVKQCVTDGLQMADAALLLDSGSESAWSYKTNLFLEAAKLAEMEGMDLAKATYLKQSKDAGKQAMRISEQRRRAEQSGDFGLESSPRELPPPPSPPPSQSPRKPINE